MNRPLLLGHRGVRARRLGRLSSNLPIENSIAAFDYAVVGGCDGFEFDVRHTGEGRNVLWHDPDWNGQNIATTDYRDLIDRGGNSLALLEDVLAHFGDRAWLDIELKVSGNEESVIAALQGNPPQRGLIVSSFLPDVLLQLHDLAPDLPLGYICDRDHVVSLWRELPIQVVLPHYGLVQSQLVAEVHQRGLQIMTWTVNEPRKMLELAECGMDGIISDDPHRLYQTFHSG